MFINKPLIWICLCTTYLSTISCAPPVSTTSSLVVSTTETSKEITSSESTTEDNVPILPKIYEMRVDTNVSNRFAKTLVTSKVRNLAKTAQQATFSVVIPDQAYISGFTMEIDGKSYEAYVQEKEEAKNTYDKAVASGIGAAHVAVNARDSNRFTVSVNIEPQSKATFLLKYEELLPRQNEKYELVLNIHPGQPIKNLDVEVNIVESRPLKFVKAPPLRSGNEIAKNDEKLDPKVEIKMINESAAVVKFSPDIERQKQLANGLGTKEENGLAGQFVVQYDVERDPYGGEVLVDGGYFVHFFAPSDLPALPKQVVFVLDTSGSMDGIRITQLKEAMNSILSELKPVDVFNIVEFGSTVKVWNVANVAVQYELGDDPWAPLYSDNQEKLEKLNKSKADQVLPPAFDATTENLEKAKQVVKKLQAFGGTDIKSALKVGLELVVKNIKEDSKKHQPIIVFLTDGEATVGEINNDKIISTISELNSGKSPIFSLSFGDGADRNFLQKISLKNLGFARHIYEGADASLQLQEFYKQISSPVLSNVAFKYVANVSEVTKTDFPILFGGSEIVVCGTISPGFVPPPVECTSVLGPIKLTPKVYQSVGRLERLWAYLTVKQILEQRDAAEDKTGPTREALRIALKYSFVTDVSSLVVVKPDEKSAVDTVDASSTDYRYPIMAAGGCSNCFALSSPPRPAAAAGGAYSGHFSAFPALQEPLPIQEEDRLVGGQLLTTPVSSIQKLQTTIVLLSSTTQKSTDKTDSLQTKLPWLSELYNADNDTLTLESGTYKLGSNESIPSKQECENSPKNSTGLCTLIHECQKIYTDLTDVKIYSKYFCKLQGYAGVCCPKEEKEEKKID